MRGSTTSSIRIAGPEKQARQVVGAFRIPQEFPESLPQWVITRISASFITTCSSIPDLTTHAPTGGRAGGLMGGLPPAHLPARARERDESNAPAASISLSNLSTSRHVYATQTHPNVPLFSASSPTDARRPPRKCSWLGYSEQRDGTRYSGGRFSVRIVCVCIGTCVTSTSTRTCSECMHKWESSA